MHEHVGKILDAGENSTSFIEERAVHRGNHVNDEIHRPVVRGYPVFPRTTCLINSLNFPSATQNYGRFRRMTLIESDNHFTDSFKN